MKRLTVTRFLVLLITLGLACLAWAAGPGASAIRITGVQAKLFYDDSGTLSDDVLNNPDAVLWNVPIGAGSAKGPTSSLVVLVELSGPKGQAELRRIVQFKAGYRTTELDTKGKPVSREVRVKNLVAPGTFGADGKSFVGFW